MGTSRVRRWGMGGPLPAVILALSVVSVGAGTGAALGGRWWAVGLAVVSLGAALPFGWAVRRGEPYAGSRLGLVRLVVDATWSAPNTWLGAAYYAAHRLGGNTHEPQRSFGAGSIWLTRGFLPCGVDGDGRRRYYATTLGTVKAGSNSRVDPHEQFHVFQARLLGPLYVPAVIVNYIVATVLPYWILIGGRRRVRGVSSYFNDGVYPHVWNEWWAYRRKGPFPPAVG